MENEQSNKFLIPGAIVVAGVLVALAIYAGGSKVPARDNVADTTAQASAITASDHFRGNNDAELTIVEYSDTECPFCKTFHNTLQQIMATYNGKVAWVYRQFPIVQLHSRAPKEAEALECVAELGGNTAFWNYLDKIFAVTNSNDSLDPAQLPVLAKTVGVDLNAFDTCLSSGRYTKKIQDSVAEAIKAGARGTPFSVIVDKKGNQTIINGAEPLANVKAKLDALLK